MNFIRPIALSAPGSWRTRAFGIDDDMVGPCAGQQTRTIEVEADEPLIKVRAPVQRRDHLVARDAIGGEAVIGLESAQAGGERLVEDRAVRQAEALPQYPQILASLGQSAGRERANAIARHLFHARNGGAIRRSFSRLRRGAPPRPDRRRRPPKAAFAIPFGGDL
jgi:hypothetical protein